MGFFEPSVMGGGGGGGHEGPHHNFVVVAPMIMKFGTGVKLEVFYTVVTKTCVTSLLLRHYRPVFQQTRRPKFQMLVTPKPPG